VLAILVQVLPPLRPSRTATIVINVDHFAERHGLMIIIVLGESLVSVALGQVPRSRRGFVALIGYGWPHEHRADRRRARRCTCSAWRRFEPSFGSRRRGVGSRSCWSRWRRFRSGRAPALLRSC
jgi:hypothetical protein